MGWTMLGSCPGRLDFVDHLTLAMKQPYIYIYMYVYMYMYIYIYIYIYYTHVYTHIRGRISVIRGVECCNYLVTGILFGR